MKHSINRRVFLAIAAGAPVLGEDDSSPPMPFGDFPVDGMVPNEETAKAIAKAVAKACYGPNAMNGPLPVSARLLAGDKIWRVGETLPPGSMGGGIVVNISRYNGCISLLRRTK